MERNPADKLTVWYRKRHWMVNQLGSNVMAVVDANLALQLRVLHSTVWYDRNHYLLDSAFGRLSNGISQHLALRPCT